MSSFFQTWTKHCPKDSPDGMNEKIITRFTKTAQNVVDLKDFFAQNETFPELRFIKQMLTSIQKTIKTMFFTTNGERYLVELIDKLWVDTEAALSTVYKIDFYADADDPMTFLLLDDHEAAE